jgi:curli production assembly/transport component CsgF
MKLIYLISLVVFGIQSMGAQDLVYRPRNPAFGGDTFNYQWLLNSAESQNTFTGRSITQKAQTE